jgi:phospholipase D1/2
MAAATHSSTLFRPGRNCQRVLRARRATLLVDGEAYFRAFAQAALQATRSIVIVGWDFHSKTRLHLEEPGVPDRLGDFLNYLARRKRHLRIFVLVWDCPPVFARQREARVRFEDGWHPHRRVRFRYDSNCPLGGALHQKLVVIDAAVGFCGGIDLTLGRWDTSEHLAVDPRRPDTSQIDPHVPVHDVMLAVDGAAARGLQTLASDRWERATGRPLPSFDTQNDPWPPSLAPMFHDVEVALARTIPERAGEAAIAEVEALYLDMIAAARGCIYIENQYFTAKVLGDALAARLEEPDGPEIVVVLRLSSSGWLEEPTMAALRSILLRKLRDADRHGRLQVCYPNTLGDTYCDVHSKLMIVDDEWLRVGSANFANRSMGLDTECDLVIAAGGRSATRAAIAMARETLLAEHLGVTALELQNALRAASGSPVATIAALSKSSGRTLRHFERLDEPSTVITALAIGVTDPERPVSLDEFVTGFIPATAATT